MCKEGPQNWCLRLKHFRMSRGCFNFPSPTLAYRRARGDMIETYKLFHRYDQEVVPDLGQVQGTTRGHSKKLYCIRHYFRVQLFSRFWPGAVIREWLISRFS